MSPRKRAALTLAATLVLLAGAVATMRFAGLPPGAMPAPAIPAAPATAPQSRTPSHTTGRMQAAPAAPLPAPGTAFDTIAADLAARADAGDAGAACRVSLELLRCRHLLRVPGIHPISLQQKAVQAESVGERAAAEGALIEGDRLALLEERCRTIAPEMLDRAPHWLRQAALAGEREALLQYIDGRNLFSEMDFSYIDKPHFELWRREAPGLLNRVLADGEPQAAIWMAEGRGGGEGAIQGLLANDPARARTWLVVVHRLFEGRLPMSVPVLPAEPEERTQIAETAARWHARWFAGRTATLRDKPILDLLPSLDPNAIDVGTGCGAPR